MQTPTYYGNIGVMRDTMHPGARLRRRIAALIGTMARRRQRRRASQDGGAGVVC